MAVTVEGRMGVTGRNGDLIISSFLRRSHPSCSVCQHRVSLAVDARFVLRSFVKSWGASTSRVCGERVYGGRVFREKVYGEKLFGEKGLWSLGEGSMEKGSMVYGEGSLGEGSLG